MYLLGLDIGSSSVKATLLDADENAAIATAQHPKVEMSMISIQSGWAEQHPEDWWQSVVHTLKKVVLKSKIQASDIKAIGISYQMHGLVIVDKAQTVLRPSIIWCDSRAVSLGEEAFSELGKEYCQRNLLNSPGNFTASKLAWISQHEPQIYSKIFKAMLPGDYIAMKLSGQIQTTMSGLSEGILFDFRENALSKEVLNHFNISKNLIPAIVPTFGIQAEVSTSVAKAIGLSKGTPITYRAGDQPNNALSLNVLQPGELVATGGTSGVIYGVTDQLKNDHISRVNAFAHVNHSVIQRRIGLLMCINGTGILNAWARKNMGNLSYEKMNQLAADVPIGAEGLTILPFGNGAERILQNKDIGAHILGLQFNLHNKSHVFRALQEGIACSMRYGIDIMKKMDLNPTVIRAGNANMFLSDIYQKAIANLTNTTIELYDTDGAQGAARAAGIGLKHYSILDAFKGLKLIRRISPSEEEQDQYEEVYRSWKQCLNTIQNA